MRLIGLAGQKRNGKDSIADCLCSKFQLNRVAFADPVRDIFNYAFGGDRDFIEEWKTKAEPPPGFVKTVRESLQFIGDGFRGIAPNVWIDKALRDLGDPAVITDARYFSEISRIKQVGGINVLVYRTGYINSDDHPSESQIRPLVEWFLDRGFEGVVSEELGEMPPGVQLIDIFLRNDGTLEDLCLKVDKLIVPFLEQKYGSF